jgi:hypothetical protein
VNRLHLRGALIAVLVLAGSSCSPAKVTTSPTAPHGGGGTSTSEPSTIAGGGQVPTPTTAGGGPGRSPTTRAGRPGGSTPSTAGTGDDPDDGVLGSLSRGFFRPAPYTKVVVQIDVGGDAAPSTGVVNRITDVLHAQTGKPVALVNGPQFAGKGDGCWTNDDIVAAARRNRKVHTEGSAIGLQVLFLDAHSCSDTVDQRTGQKSALLGLAFAASTFAIFGPETAAEARLGESPDAYVKAVTIHELGHVFGLVNLGYHSKIDHEDTQPGHEHHSKNSQSVMYWQIEQQGLVQRLTNPGSTGPPQDFDADDRADMKGLGDGTY